MFGRQPFLEQQTSVQTFRPDQDHVNRVMTGTLSDTLRYPHTRSTMEHLIEKGTILFEMKNSNDQNSNGTVRGSLCGADIGGCRTESDVHAFITYKGIALQTYDFNKPTEWGTAGLIGGTFTFDQNPTGQALAGGEWLAIEAPKFTANGNTAVVDKREYTFSREWETARATQSRQKRHFSGRNPLPPPEGKLGLKLVVYDAKTSDTRLMDVNNANQRYGRVLQSIQNANNLQAKLDACLDLRELSRKDEERIICQVLQPATPSGTLEVFLGR